MKHIVIIAGEASGDQHAAHLVDDLKKQQANLRFSGVGGKKMLDAGVTIIQDIAPLNIMGFVDVLLHFKTIRRIFKATEDYLKETRPDLLILVDYPGFNLRLAKKAKTMGIKIMYYISPQLWAWKPGRIKTIQANVDVMAVILPFEKKIYDAVNMPAYFVGHPLIDTIDQHNQHRLSDTGFRNKWNIPLNKKIIGILPGSRRGEIQRIFPIMLKTAELLHQHYPDLIFVLPIAPTLSWQDFDGYCKNSTLILNQNLYTITTDRYDLIQSAHSLMVTSGTATLETALFAKPLVLVYKTSLINYAIAQQVIRVRYIGLCNLLAQKMLIPEIVQWDLTPEHLFQAMQHYLDDHDSYQRTVNELRALHDSLIKPVNAPSLCDIVLKLLT